MIIRHLCLTACLLGLNIFFCNASFSQSPSPPLANNAEDDNRVNENSYAEERKAAQNFIENINEARKELSIQQPTLARQKVIMARNLLPLILSATPAQRRLVRVEFGGGFYADDLNARKSYIPIETQSLENLTRGGGPRWLKNTRSESDAVIIYITLDLANDKAKIYLDHAEKEIVAGNFKNAETQLAELSDRVVKINDSVPSAMQARDYLTLAYNYIAVGNFFGARSSLEHAKVFLDNMKDDDIYREHRFDIISLHKSIDTLQVAFAKLDTDQIKSAEDNLKKWQRQLAGWVQEEQHSGP